MQFFYHKNAGMPSIELDVKDSHYLFCVRRFKDSEILKVRNLEDKNIYFYTHKKKNTFLLQNTEKQDDKDKQARIPFFHLILAIIDPKDIYETLPQLNALNLASINFYYADFSQKNRKLDTEKMQRILQYSCMQCNRDNLMKIHYYNSLNDVMADFPNACAIDFIEQDIAKDSLQHADSNLTWHANYHKNITFENLEKNQKKLHAQQGIIIGPEGGFSKKERDTILKNKQCYALEIPHILTAHLASIYVASICASL